MLAELLAGPDRLHFKNEKPSRRRTILSVIGELPVTTMVFESKRKEPEARRWAIGRLLAHLDGIGGHGLVIEAAVAWAYGAGGDWRRRVTPAVVDLA
jgi:hypothetical protein